MSTNNGIRNGKSSTKGIISVHYVQEKIESAYYQVTQIAINKIPRLQKLQHTFKIKEIVKTANEAIAEILKDKYVDLTEIHHLIYAAATVITEEINGTECYKSETQQSKTTPVGYTHTGEYKWYQERSISLGRNKKR